MIVRQEYSFSKYWFDSKVARLIRGKKDGLHKVWTGLDKEPDFMEIGFILKKAFKVETPEIECTLLSNKSLSVAASIGEIVVLLDWNGVRAFDLSLFGGSEKEHRKIRALLDEYLSTLRLRSAERVGVTFSYLTNQGPRFYYRQVVCPTWDEVQDNYPNKDNLNWLFTTQNPLDYGKLVFWHGKPGTGKTYLIRALMQEWKKKADFVYVLDPENLFGKAGYLVETLLHNPESEEKEGPKEKLKVFVIEDALDFLLAENRKEISSAMSRLLNLTEGIVGQGFQILVLITSNEDVGRVDPAFTRAGRCLQLLEFGSLTEKEAKCWLRKHSALSESIEDRDSWTLAELYACLRPAIPGREKQVVPVTGFKM